MKSFFPSCRGDLGTGMLVVLRVGRYSKESRGYGVRGFYSRLDVRFPVSLFCLFFLLWLADCRSNTGFKRPLPS